MPVKLAELVENFELMSMTSGDSHAYLCRQTGEFYCRMDSLYVGDEYAGELPDDIDDEKKYVALPDKRELDLGKPLVMDFVRAVLTQDLDDVRVIGRPCPKTARPEAVASPLSASNKEH